MSKEKTAMAPRLESPTKLSVKVDAEDQEGAPMVKHENPRKLQALVGTPERGGYETTAGVNNQVVVQDSSESAASSPRPVSPVELDRYGFIRHLQQHVNGVVETIDQQRQERRVQKWNLMLENLPQLKKRRSRLLLRRLRKGVPHTVRPQVWVALCETKQRKQGLYDKLVLESTQMDRASMNEQEKAFTKIQDTIERDIHRTFPRHSLFYDKEEVDSVEDGGHCDTGPVNFCDTADLAADIIRDLELNGEGGSNSQASSSMRRVHHPDERSASFVLKSQGGQASLRRLLKAYSVYDPEIGYCQGMNFIAGMFLTLVPEEEAFWMLVAVMSDEPCQMRGLFAEGMRETHKVLFVAEKLVHHFLPRLAKHLDREHIHVTMYATQWLLTQYTSSFPFDLVLRVWDCFLGEGWKITYRVMLSILQQHQSALLRMSFEEILAFLRELPDNINGSTVVDASIKIPLRRKQIAKYEQQWHAQQS